MSWGPDRSLDPEVANDRRSLSPLHQAAHSAPMGKPYRVEYRAPRSRAVAARTQARTEAIKPNHGQNPERHEASLRSRHSVSADSNKKEGQSDGLGPLPHHERLRRRHHHPSAGLFDMAEASSRGRSPGAARS